MFSVGSNGVYRGDGHFLLCYKKGNGGYYILESAHYYNENKPYTFNLVFNNIHQGIFAIGAK